MKLKELKELLDDYNDDAEVLVVDRSDPYVNRYHPIVGVDVEDWGKTLELVIAERN